MQMDLAAAEQANLERLIWKHTCYSVIAAFRQAPPATADNSSLDAEAKKSCAITASLVDDEFEAFITEAQGCGAVYIFLFSCPRMHVVHTKAYQLPAIQLLPQSNSAAIVSSSH